VCCRRCWLCCFCDCSCYVGLDVDDVVVVDDVDVDVVVDVVAVCAGAGCIVCMIDIGGAVAVVCGDVIVVGGCVGFLFEHVVIVVVGVVTVVADGIRVAHCVYDCMVVVDGYV